MDRPLLHTFYNNTIMIGIIIVPPFFVLGNLAAPFGDRLDTGVKQAKHPQTAIPHTLLSADNTTAHAPHQLYRPIYVFMSMCADG